MSGPYSDNLYSADLSSDDEQDARDALSPSDGYFHASLATELASESQQSLRGDSTSSNVPSVPNVLVEDPTLREQGGDKAREAAQDRLNTQASQAPTSPSQSHTSHPPFSPVHYHRRSVDEDDNQFEFVGHTLSPSSHVETSPLLQQSQQTHHQQRQQRLHQGTDAPPAYSAPASPPFGTGNGYHTFPPTQPTMGSPEEQQRIVARGPESMGGQSVGESKGTLWGRITDRLRVSNLRRKIRTALGIFVILSIFLMIFSGISMRPNHPNGFPHDPVRRPDDHAPVFKWSPPKECLNEPHVFDTYTTAIEAQFQRRLSIIHKINHEKDRAGWNPHIFGQVILRPTQNSSPASIALEVISNNKDLGVTVVFNSHEQVFEISTPDRFLWDHSQQAPCIQIRVTVEVPREAWLKALTVKTVQLDIEIKDGLVLGIMEDSILSTTSGDIHTPSLQKDQYDGVLPYLLGSRNIVIETVSGNVGGWYPLYDLLKITTASGDVDIDIDPKAVDPVYAKSAVLDVHTISGNVKLAEPLDRAVASAKPDKVFPPRDYVVYVDTVSGDVEGKLAISSSTRFSTQSGDFQLTLWPVLDSAVLAYGAPPPKLETDTKSGDTTVNLLDPTWTSITKLEEKYPFGSPSDPNEPSPPTGDGDLNSSPVKGKEPWLIIHPDDDTYIKSEAEEEGKESRGNSVSSPVATTLDTPALGSLKSKHGSISGKIDLVYPAAWEGYLWAQTISGSQDIRGDGLELNSGGRAYLRRVRGRKGHGFSDLKVDSVSGDQKILIGRA